MRVVLAVGEAATRFADERQMNQLDGGNGGVFGQQLSLLTKQVTSDEKARAVFLVTRPLSRLWRAGAGAIARVLAVV